MNQTDSHSNKETDHRRSRETSTKPYSNSTSHCLNYSGYRCQNHNTKVGQPTQQHTTVTVDTANATFSFAGTAATKDGRERRNSVDKRSGQKRGTLFFLTLREQDWRSSLRPRTERLPTRTELAGQTPISDSIKSPGGSGPQEAEGCTLHCAPYFAPNGTVCTGGSPHTLLSALARARYVLLA